MITVTVDKQERGMPNTKSFENIRLPGLPSKGDYLSHDRLGFSGYVEYIDFWFDEENKLTVTVVIK